MAHDPDDTIVWRPTITDSAGDEYRIDPRSHEMLKQETARVQELERTLANAHDAYRGTITDILQEYHSALRMLRDFADRMATPEERAEVQQHIARWNAFARRLKSGERPS